MSVAGGIIAAIVVLLVVALAGWVGFTQIRARRLGVSSQDVLRSGDGTGTEVDLDEPHDIYWHSIGLLLQSSLRLDNIPPSPCNSRLTLISPQLPPPSFASYLPWHKDSNPFGPSSGSGSGGVMGWFNDKVRKFKNRNNRSAAGSYEPSYAGAGADQQRSFGGLDPDEAWDSRVGHGPDAYAEYGEELHDGPSHTSHGGNSYSMNLASAPGAHADDYDHEDEHRGRTPAKKNPFDDENAAESLRGVSPRPLDGGAGHSNRQSVFKETV